MRSKEDAYSIPAPGLTALRVRTATAKKAAGESCPQGGTQLRAER